MVVDNIVIHHYENLGKKEKSADLNRWTVRNLIFLKYGQISLFLHRSKYNEFVAENFHIDGS